MASDPRVEGAQDILIVDDSPVQATMLRRTLTQQGYKVTIAKHGADALAKLKEQPAGLVISDVQMPVMNGYELCSAIKQDKDLQDIPVLLLTTLSAPADLMKGLMAGADSYLTKPYDEEVLLARVGAFLGIPCPPQDEGAVEVVFVGERYRITATRQRILNLLLSTYENAIQQNRALLEAQLDLKKLNQQLEDSRKEVEQLLMSILPKKVAEELIAYGASSPEKFEAITVIFTDFVGFTKAAATMAPHELVQELEGFFTYFDSVAEKHSLEKLKTIGDAYMFAGGLPQPTKTHAIDCVLAALDIQRFVVAQAAERATKGKPTWSMRVGVHTGPAVAGVIGKKKFAYDVWGDTVNLASRMESSGEAGKVNISADTYEAVKEFFVCEHRGKVAAKGKGEVDMYFVTSLNPEWSEQGEGIVPNAAFNRKYKLLAQ